MDFFFVSMAGGPVAESFAAKRALEGLQARVRIVMRIALALLTKRSWTMRTFPRTFILVPMGIHVALQIILAAEAPGALTARVSFPVGFRGHFGYLWEERWIL